MVNNMTTKTTTTEIAIAHPAEKIFDLEPGTTIVDQVTSTTVDVVENEAQYDDKDQEIDGQIQQVYDAAFSAFEAQRLSTEGMNPQFQARALEVAAQFLNTALAAVNSKASMKANKDKTTKVSNVSNNTTNNNLIMGRDEMLAMLMQRQKANEKDVDED